VQAIVVKCLIHAKVAAITLMINARGRRKWATKENISVGDWSDDATTPRHIVPVTNSFAQQYLHEFQRNKNDRRQWKQNGLLARVGPMLGTHDTVLPRERLRRMNVLCKRLDEVFELSLT
jgi:hypothetical protein